MKLTEEQRRNVGKYVNIFNEHTQTDKYREVMKERGKKLNFFKTLTKAKIQNLTEKDLEKILSMLWSGPIRHKKRILSNGIDKIRKEMLNLLYGDAPPEQRYQRFREEIKGLGPASITEILAYIHPDQCGMWNGPARKALEILGFDDILPLNKGDINANEYKEFNEIMKEIAEELKKAGYEEANPYFADYYLYYLSTNMKSKNDEIMNESFITKDIINKELEKKIDSMLSDKKQLIFYGPPGTGKTWLARTYIKLKAPEKHEIKKQFLFMGDKPF